MKEGSYWEEAERRRCMEEGYAEEEKKQGACVGKMQEMERGEWNLARGRGVGEMKEKEREVDKRVDERNAGMRKQ